MRKHTNAKRAVTYLKGRGLSGEIANAFRVGFAPPGWDNLLSALGQEPAAQALLMTNGMLVKNDKGRIYDRFRDRIMFPILDARGRVIAFGGRVLGDEKPKYLNSPETPVFQKSRELYGLYQARKANRSLTRIVVVEGYMDVIALAQHGINYAVATLGTATSETHLERLFRHVPEVIFCFDGDEAGRKAAFRGLEAALPVMQDGRQVRFLFLPEGEDPDTLVRSKGQGHLEHLFDTAAPLETFLFEQLAQGIDVNALDGKARFSKTVAPYLRRLPEGVFKVLMYQALADRTGIDVESLKRLQAPPPEPSPSDEKRSDPSSYTRAPDGHQPSPDLNALDVVPYDGTDEYPVGDYPGTAGLESLSFSESQSADFGTSTEAIIDNSLSPSRANRTHRLLGLLVLDPKLAQHVTLAELPKRQQRDSELLHACVEQIANEPDTSTATLLGFWYGTPEGQLLTELAGREALEDDEGREALFTALLKQVVNEATLAERRARFNQLKTTSYADLSADEKRELLTLTQEIRSLTGRN